MLVVEPERRYTLKQIIKHRWLNYWTNAVRNDYLPTIANPFLNGSGFDVYTTTTAKIPNLDTNVVSSMLQLPGLTADKIAQSVHENRFDNIYAIYYLLYDKLQQKRKELKELQHTNRLR